MRQRIATLELKDTVKVHGYAPAADLDGALSTAGLAINLRYPTMGEASASQLRIWEHALPSLVTRVGWYASLPEDAVAHVRPENEVALALLRRYGYAETCVLKNHIFGQDYCVMEKPYTKVIEGYDHGVGVGRLGRLIQAINRLLGR